MNDILLAIDLGTTRLKVAAFTPDGTLQHLRARRHRDQDASDNLFTARAVDAEAPPTDPTRATVQDPDAWWLDCIDLVRAVRDACSPCRVLGLSLSGRGGAGIFCDAAGEVLVRPWSDARHRQAERGLREHPAGRGTPPYTTALASKFLWLRTAAPHVAARVRHAFHAKDFLLFRLTGQRLTDWSTGPDGPHWPRALFQAFDLPESLLPTPALPWSVAGTLTSSAADALGLPTDTPVAVGAHDGICANVGAGATRPGSCAITLGTNAVVRQVRAQAAVDAPRFYGLPPDRHIIGGDALLGGRAADWYLDLIGIPEAERESTFAARDAAAGRIPFGADGVRFLPYLGGQVAPRARRGVRAAFTGLGIGHGGDHAWRAVLEGTGCAVRAIYDDLADRCGPPDRVRLTGSGARSALWRQILADLIGRPLEYSDAAVEARGAAIFLAVALGLHPDIDTAADTMVPVRGEVVPERTAAAAALYADWRNWDRALDAVSAD
jgi:gluconokinase